MPGLQSGKTALTSSGFSRQKLKNILEEDRECSEIRVKNLREEVSSGNYESDSQSIAHAILDYPKSSKK